MYSQSDEELHILKHFDGHPAASFLDCGAYHPKTFSNTRALVERGWSGTYVEPAPTNFASFLTEYRDNPAITLVNTILAAGSTDKLVAFHDSGGDALSSTNFNHVMRWKSHGVKFRQYLTKTTTWLELFDAVGRDFTMLSIDAEGSSVALLRALIDLDLRVTLPQLTLITVEHDGQHEQISADLRPCGFGMIALNGENAIFTR